ncbi:MAG: carbon-nitrogen hydrolase family protein [bacterium]
MPENDQKITVAIIQDTPVFLNLDRSVEKACALIGQAAKRGAQLIAFPETWLPGYPVWLDFAPGAGLWDHPPAKAIFTILFENSVTLSGPHVQKLAKATKAAKSVVVMGAHERLGCTLYNTMLYFSASGDLAAIHRKLIPTYTERLLWGRGDGSTLAVVDTDIGRVGGLICWEHWMPLARTAMHAKQELLHVAQWPMVKEMNLVASRHYAFEGRCFVLAAGCVLRRGELFDGLPQNSKTASLARQLLNEIPGKDEDLILRGGSTIFAPDGVCLAGPLHDEVGILCATISPEQVTEGKMALDVSGHYTRPDVFQLHVNEQLLVDVSFKK